jgi:2,3-bisphosphoglycerate-independent phosphoglycerate mutase
VPFIVTGDKGALELSGEPGTLADVAPTMLAIMGFTQPEGEWLKLFPAYR